VPMDGADEVKIAPPQTFRAPAITASSTNSASQADDESSEALGYESLEITSPRSEETIWNTGGKVTVAVSLRPVLQMGHQIRLFMDGQQLADLPPKASSVQLSEVYRGEHQLRAEVHDENGKVLTTSKPLTFFYQQTSVNRR